MGVSGAEQARKLETAYREFQNKEIKISRLLEVVNDAEVLQYAKMLINKESINPEYPYTPQDIEFIHILIQVCQFIYDESSFEPPLTDAEYDILYAIMVANGETDEVSQPIYPSKRNVVHHKYPTLRGTLKKIYYLTDDEPRIGKSRQSLDEWLASREKMLSDKGGMKVSLKKEKIYVFPKWDGVSSVLEFDENGTLLRALTRGDTSRNEAQDITEKIKHVPFTQHLAPWPFGLKVEVMMSEENKDRFNYKYGTGYRNSRSIVSAILMSDEVDPEKLEFLTLKELRVQDHSPLEYLADAALRTDPYIVTTLSHRDKIRKFADEHHYVKGFRCDGAVIQFANPNVQSALGRDNDMNNFEVAYKFTEEVVKSHVKGVSFQVGLFGTVTPVIHFDGRRMKGNLVSSASLGSMGRFKDLNLHKDDEISVHYDIIPYITKDKGAFEGTEEIPLPKVCSVCGHPLEFTESEAFCSNPDCPSRKTGSFVNYITKMGIKGISFKRIQRMLDAGILQTVVDLYHLDDFKNQICEIRGLGPLTYETMKAAVDARRKVTPARFMGSIGIAGCSQATFDKITREMTIEDLLKTDPKKLTNELANIPGLGFATASKIVESIEEKKPVIKALLKELDLQEPPKFNPKWVICFHLIRDPELELQIVDELGGKVVRSLTKETTYFVVPDGEIPQDNKTNDAHNRGIPIVGISEFKNEILPNNSND